MILIFSPLSLIAICLCPNGSEIIIKEIERRRISRCHGWCCQTKQKETTPTIIIKLKNFVKIWQHKKLLFLISAMLNSWIRQWRCNSVIAFALLNRNIPNSILCVANNAHHSEKRIFRI